MKNEDKAPETLPEGVRKIELKIKRPEDINALPSLENANPLAKVAAY